MKPTLPILQDTAKILENIFQPQKWKIRISILEKPLRILSDEKVEKELWIDKVIVRLLGGEELEIDALDCGFDENDSIEIWEQARMIQDIVYFRKRKKYCIPSNSLDPYWAVWDKIENRKF